MKQIMRRVPIRDDILPHTLAPFECHDLWFDVVLDESFPPLINAELRDAIIFHEDGSPSDTP